MCKTERWCRKEHFAHFYLNGTPDVRFFYMGGRYDTTGVTPGKKKCRILTSVAWGLHEVKRVETKMGLPDTLWFARKDCRILALLVNKCKENSKRTGE